MENLTSLLLLLALVVGLFWIMAIPARRQAERARKMREALAPGTRVQLVGGLFATVKHVGKEQAVFEMAPGVEVTGMKAAVSRVVEADEEEFEFEDELVESTSDTTVDAEPDSSSSDASSAATQHSDESVTEVATATSTAHDTSDSKNNREQ